MKKFILSALIAVFSVTASAQGDIISASSEEEQTYEQVALELLATSKDTVITVNSSNQPVNGRPVINDAFNYIISEISSVFDAFLFGSNDEEDENSYTGNISELAFKCDENVAKCELKIKYNNSQQTVVEYKLDVRDGAPVAISQNQVTIK